MSNFGSTLLAPPQALTTAAAQAKLLAQITSGIRANFQRNVADYNRMYNAVWSNSDGLTPAQSLAGLGTSAASIFAAASALAALINTAVPGTITVTPPAFTINDDGTITLNS